MGEAGSATGRVVVLVLPAVNLLDLGGPVQVFDAAARLGAGYRMEFAADLPEMVAAQGLRLAGLQPLPPVRPGDLVLVPGPRLHEPQPGAPLVSARRGRLGSHRISRRGAHRVSLQRRDRVGRGRLVGRSALHHPLEPGRPDARAYPAARVLDGVLYVHDGMVSTSAGIAAGIDLALSFVERDHGPVMTAAVCRQLVVYLRRGGAGAQISPFLEHRAHLNSAVHRVQDHIAQHLDSPLTQAELAAAVHLSARALSRAFTTTIGITPLEYQQRLRLERGATLLAETDLTIDSIAARCGFRDPRHFRRLFTARYGAPPSASREHTPLTAR